MVSLARIGIVLHMLLLELLPQRLVSTSASKGVEGISLLLKYVTDKTVRSRWC